MTDASSKNASGGDREPQPAASASPSPLAWTALVMLVAVFEAIIWFGLPYTWQGLPESWRYRSHFLLAILVVLPFAAISPVRDAVASGLDRLRCPAPRSRRVLALLIGLVASGLALWRIDSAGQPLYPLLHDEHSYLLQAQQLARLRLWMPAHDLADFFDSFHILVEPVYASIYWPGTGLFNVWGVWLGLPHFVIPIVLYALTVALTYLIATEVTDGVGGLIAALLISAQPHLAAFSTRVMSQIPAALLGAALIWTFLRWRSTRPDRRLAWVGLMGVTAGWMGVTRPVDALAFAIPVGFAVLVTLIRHGSQADAAGASPVADSGPRWRAMMLTIGVGVLCALPFLALQAVLNQGTTGSILHPPYVEYLNRYQPGTEYGAGKTEDTRIVSDLLQKQELYEHFVVKELNRRREQGAWRIFFRERLAMTARASLPSLWLLPLAAAGAFVAIGGFRRAAALDATVPRLALVTGMLFVVMYLSNPFFLSHYALPVAVPMTLMSAIGATALGRAAHGHRRAFVVTLVAGVATTGLVISILHYRFARPFPWFTEQHDLEFKYNYLPPRLQGRTVVLVRYTGSGEGEPFHWDPVYNSGVAWPDDADVLWAHDLEGRRTEILAHYARKQPDRLVVLWNRTEGALYDLGRVTRALADQRSGAIDRMLRETPALTTQPTR